MYHISQGIGGDHPLLSIFIESTSLRREAGRRMSKWFFGIPLSYESLVCVDRYAEEEGEIEYGNGPENQCQESLEEKIGKPNGISESAPVCPDGHTLHITQIMCAGADFEGCMNLSKMCRTGYKVCLESIESVKMVGSAMHQVYN